MTSQIYALAYSLGLSRGQLILLAREAARDAKVRHLVDLTNEDQSILLGMLRTAWCDRDYLLRNIAPLDMIAA